MSSTGFLYNSNKTLISQHTLLIASFPRRVSEKIILILNAYSSNFKIEKCVDVFKINPSVIFHGLSATSLIAPKGEVARVELSSTTIVAKIRANKT